MNILKPAILLFTCLIVIGSVSAFSQITDYDSASSFTLDGCIDYAMHHQPVLQQARINQAVTRETNRINLSGWLPQVNATANVVHYNQLPTSFISDSAGGASIPRQTGVVNTIIPQVSVTQQIFNPQLVYAAKTVPLYDKQARQYTDSAKIGLVVAVSKAFYSLLFTLQQIDVLKEDTARLDRNVMDTYHQFVGGIVDETDYDEAVITLNNSKAQLFQQIENISPQYAALKQYMGYPPRGQFNVSFDTSQMMQEIDFDTTQQLAFEQRIEYQELQTEKQLQHEVTRYYGLSFLPTVSFNYNYFFEYENNQFSNLFSGTYPYSYFGFGLTLPIFTGFSRWENIHKSRLQEEELHWSEVNLKGQIYTEYTNALANYKGQFYNLQLLKENVDKAKNVYRIVSLQYKQGTVAYLNMIVAESNLIAAETGYITALYTLLSTRIDLEKAMGLVPYKN